jgi:hypothetical protein
MRYHQKSTAELDNANVWLYKRAIKNMGYFLNGECVLRRWARENGLFTGTRGFHVPEYLTDDMQQYMIDICYKYCVLEDCVD